MNVHLLIILSDNSKIALFFLKPAEGAVIRIACGLEGEDCCGFSEEIAVKNCGGHLVYYLRGVPGCSYAYCAGRFT